ASTALSTLSLHDALPISQDGFDGVEDDGMPYEPIEPREDQMGLVPELAAQRAALEALDRLQTQPDLARLRGGEHANREGEAVARSEEHTSELQSLAYLVC